MSCSKTRFIRTIRFAGISEFVEISNRRYFLKGALVTATVSAVAACTSEQNPGNFKPSTFVLVHGAWHGGWCWKYVRDLLLAKGHRVFTPTMAGLGERSHLLSADIGLDTHIEDVVRHIEFEELEDIILVGHSYGGMVITGVVDRLKERIGHIVYLDAGIPKDGDHFGSQSPGATPESMQQYDDRLTASAAKGVGMDVFSPTFLGIPETDVKNTEWVAKHMTPHPVKTWQDRITLVNNGSEGVASTYIHCVDPPLRGSSFALHYERLSQDKTWQTKTLSTGHDAMVTMPNEVSDILTTL